MIKIGNILGYNKCIKIRKRKAPILSLLFIIMAYSMLLIEDSSELFIVQRLMFFGFALFLNLAIINLLLFDLELKSIKELFHYFLKTPSERFRRLFKYTSIFAALSIIFGVIYIFVNERVIGISIPIILFTFTSFILGSFLRQRMQKSKNNNILEKVLEDE